MLITNFKLNEDIVLQELPMDNGGYWCFNTSTGDCFKLNATSYQFLSCFKKSISFEDAYRNIKEVCGCLPDSAYKELEEIFNYSIGERVISKVN